MTRKITPTITDTIADHSKRAGYSTGAPNVQDAHIISEKIKRQRENTANITSPFQSEKSVWQCALFVLQWALHKAPAF